MCSGCVSDDIRLASKQAVRLPPAPSFLAPVPEPTIKAGDDAKVVLARALATLKVANARLTVSRATYEQMRARYGGKPK